LFELVHLLLGYVGVEVVAGSVGLELLENKHFGWFHLVQFGVVGLQFHELVFTAVHVGDHGSFEGEASTYFVVAFDVGVDDGG
jgi:uncharacterized membrane protein YeaQ/YmgE (transglycosylase-associated protein family)